MTFYRSLYQVYAHFKKITCQVFDKDIVNYMAKCSWIECQEDRWSRSSDKKYQKKINWYLIFLIYLWWEKTVSSWYISKFLSFMSFCRGKSRYIYKPIGWVRYCDSRGTLLSSLSLVVNLICLVLMKVNCMSFSVSIDGYVFSFFATWILHELLYCHLFSRFVK